MKKYELTEEDIDAFVGLAAEAVISGKTQMSQEARLYLIGFAREIADTLLDHLNGKNVFSEGDIEFMKIMDKIFSKQMDK